MELTATQIQKYKKYSTPELREKAGMKFRKWIRSRDHDQPCISCGSWNTSDAGHYYSAGHYPELEFNEDNVHGQCRKCNMFLSGNLLEYRKGLIKKIGEQRVIALDFVVDCHRRIMYKHDRFTLIEIILKYSK
jgi:hypothetical protein